MRIIVVTIFPCSKPTYLKSQGQTRSFHLCRKLHHLNSNPFKVIHGLTLNVNGKIRTLHFKSEPKLLICSTFDIPVCATYYFPLIFLNKVGSFKIIFTKTKCIEKGKF